ncbi:hypothetical protein NMG60_11015983 [Bertholletia excelsa]
MGICVFLSVAGALVYVEKRGLWEVVPPGVKIIWQEWELRALILTSLALQIILIVLGKRRKYAGKTWIRITLWSAYLIAEWVATVALGVISHTIQEKCSRETRVAAQPNKELMAFWTPFLLLHLGGPDTITAYSLEDNQLWLRHLLGLVVQTGVALYIFQMAWPGSRWLPILSIPLLQAGLIKYGERTWALRSANSEHLRDSMLTPPDPGPNYAKFMEEFTLKKAEGFYVRAEEVIEDPIPPGQFDPKASEQELILKAFELFQTFKRLFVDLILSFQDRDSSKSFQKLEPETAFHVIEVELGFAFDMLYTKTPVVYTLRGCFLRLFTFGSTFSVLIAFFFVSKNHHYHSIDVVITYLLLVAALLLEIYAVVLMLRSDWTVHWLSKHKTAQKFLMVQWLKQREKRWWSNSMAQYNLLSFALREKPTVCLGIQKLLRIDQLLEKHRYNSRTNVSKELKKLLFEQFKKFLNSKDQDPSALWTHRGGFNLKQETFAAIGWSIELEFDQSILVWHIATDLCYYMEDGCENTTDTSTSRESSKHISDYMLYLLVMCPAMLPIGIGMIRFRDTCAEAREFFQERSIAGKKQACQRLLQVNTEVLPIKVKGDRSKSVLFDACRLAKFLQKLRVEKWKIMSHVWAEMLAYAATRSRGNNHVQQLRKGGELLTHVWLLMAHLGITEQFQIHQGHARVKLMTK